jgi:hypothetical protein
MWVLRHYELSSLVDLVTSTGGNIYGLIFLFEWKVEHEMHPVQHRFVVVRGRTFARIRYSLLVLHATMLVMVFVCSQ